MSNTLLVFYSRSGTTRALACRLARELDADLEEIRERHDRKGWRGFLRSLFESLSGRDPAIVPCRFKPADYALVVVGTPVWAERPAGPVRRYLLDHEAELNHVAFFCTYSHNGAAALAEMADIVDCEPIATLMLSGPEVEAGDSGQSARFVSEVFGSVRWGIENRRFERIMPVAPARCA
ncbi:flavodoxin family protein [Solimonas terrae]|uniref:Flavodoxin n=1 Tax=Solimonas terrae TaxID=1396819 RepID=A0A6M2BKA8_9GAMM|nr:flavodoxin [Solimonas terrae]NGY03206.1 flavodoxin [Solimonas terrae]